MLVVRSSGSVQRKMGVLLRKRNCSIRRTSGNTSKLGGLAPGAGLIVLSVVVPNVSKLGAYRRVEGVSCIPVLFLATGSGRSSGLVKFVTKTSSCLVGPFSCARLFTEIETLLHHRRICSQRVLRVRGRR